MYILQRLYISVQINTIDKVMTLRLNVQIVLSGNLRFDTIKKSEKMQIDF